MLLQDEHSAWMSYRTQIFKIVDQKTAAAWEVESETTRSCCLYVDQRIHALSGDLSTKDQAALAYHWLEV